MAPTTKRLVEGMEPFLDSPEVHSISVKQILFGHSPKFLTTHPSLCGRHLWIAPIKLTEDHFLISKKYVKEVEFNLNLYILDTYISVFTW